MCVFVRALRLYPSTPSWGVRCGCVCLDLSFGCAPPLLAGVFGCVCVCVRAPLVPCHSCLGCAVWVCVLQLSFRLRPAYPGWGVGGGVGLSARSACTPPLLAGACGAGVCAWARVSAAPRHSWLGCWGVCVFVCRLCLYPATPGWGVRCGCVCLGSGFKCAPRLLAVVLGCVFVCLRALLVLHHSWLGCVLWVWVFGLRFRLCPVTPGWGVGLCVCLCAHSACTLQLLAGVCGVAVCAWARVSAAPRHSWPGCWAVCVFVCALRLYLATPGWGLRCGCVCLGSGVGFAPPLLAGVLGCVCVCMLAPPGPVPLQAGACGAGVCAWALFFAAPRHSWLGCWGVCVYLCARSACTPPLLAGPCCAGVCAWALVSAAPRHSGLGCWGVCVCLCAHSACTLPLPAGVCGVGVCAWALVSAVPRHSWLGCWGVCLFVCALWLYPTSPGSGVWCGCGCLGSGFGCAPPLLADVFGSVCVCVRTPLVPWNSWLGCAVSVCVLGLGSRLPPATPSWGARFCVCVFVRALLVPRHSWLGCAVCVCVLGLGCPLRPATPGWGVGVYVS